MPTTYNQYQQLYCLSAASNAVGGMKANEADLQAAMDTTLAEYIPTLTGSWAVTWGPRVFKSKPKDQTMGPDNAWFAAVDDTQKLCVVAVAGTSAHTTAGWNIDLDVQEVVDFNGWTNTWPSQASQGIKPASAATPVLAGTAYVSLGTCIGVYNILNNPSSLAASGQLLGDYIANSVPAGYKVIFTGHSMGGAVAPTAALGAVNAKWSPLNNTFILPSAGASAGNAELVQASTAVFPPGPAPSSSEPYAVMNTDFFNTLDVVPQAWSVDQSSDRNLNNINNIYSNASLAIRIYIKNLVNKLIKKAESSGTTYEPLPGTSFTGPPIPVVTTAKELSTQVMLEHTTAYWQIIGITDWVQQIMKKLKEQPGVEELPLESPDIAGDDEVNDEIKDS